MQAPAALFMLQLQQGLHAASRIMQSLGPFLHQGSLACVSAGARTQWLGHSTSTQGKQSDAGKKRAEQRQTSTSKASNFGSDRLSPHLPYVKQSKSQRCFTQSVQNALNQVLVMDPKLKEALIQPFGVAVTAVKLSRDRQEAIVLWDCWQGKEAECTQALRSQATALRSCLAEHIGGRSVPFLELRRDRLKPRMQQAVNLLKLIEQEQKLTKQAASTAQESPQEETRALGKSRRAGIEGIGKTTGVFPQTPLVIHGSGQEKGSLRAGRKLWQAPDSGNSTESRLAKVSSWSHRGGVDVSAAEVAEAAAWARSAFVFDRTNEPYYEDAVNPVADPECKVHELVTSGAVHAGLDMCTSAGQGVATSVSISIPAMKLLTHTPSVTQSGTLCNEASMAATEGIGQEDVIAAAVQPVMGCAGNAAAEAVPAYQTAGAAWSPERGEVSPVASGSTTIPSYAASSPLEHATQCLEARIRPKAWLQAKRAQAAAEGETQA